MPFIVPFLPYIAAAGAVAGAGISYAQGVQAAKTQSTMALMNAQAQSQAAMQQGQLGQMQASINKALADKDAQAAQANATALEQQAKIGTDIAQDNVAATREQFAQAIAAQRVQMAKAGVADTTGSPLDLLAKTAAQEQQAADSIRYDDEQNRRQLFAGAAEQRNQGLLAKISGLSAMSQGASSKGAALAQLAQSKLDLYGARAQAQAMKTQAVGGLISSVGGIASSAYQTFRATPRGNPAPYAAYTNSSGYPRAQVVS